MKWIRTGVVIGAAMAFVGSPALAQTCANSVQGKIAWSTEGRTDWDPSNVERLCEGQEASLEPGICFANFIQKDWGWPEALEICEGVSSSVATKNCYESSTRNEKKTKAERIAKCNQYGRTSEPETPNLVLPPFGAGSLRLDPITINRVRQDGIKDLKITTQNVWYLNAGPIMVSDNNSERMENMRRGRTNGTFLSGQDIVVFNELFDHDYQERVYRAIAREYPHRTPVAGRGDSRGYWDEDLGQYASIINNSGVSVVSKWPILKKIQFLYPDSSRSGLDTLNNMPGVNYLPDDTRRNPDFLCADDTLANKGFVYVKINYQNKIPVHVIATHTQAEDNGCDNYGRLPRGYQIGWRQRDKTFRLIKNFIDGQNIPEGEAIFVAGDLNVRKGTDEYERMLRSLNAADPTVTGHDATWDPATNGNIDSDYRQDKPQFLDYVLPIKNGFYAANWNNHVVKNSAYSDHYGVEGSVKVVSNPVIVDPNSYVDYRVSFRTGDDGTDADVYVTLIGDAGRSVSVESTELMRDRDNLEAGSMENFTIKNARIGDLKKIRIRIRNKGPWPAWELIEVKVRNLRTNQIKVWRGEEEFDSAERHLTIKTLDLN